ncbi:hypothetical protein MYCTH_2309591 [Thermothelomyces thermophilus ATCC 42464]|uniref:Uncharacterized protein n=1 Tax=Thermothelomyces thermophilus (strain ATCC 42464 / BCRC 31852 / DSM 1799) TaxID=573729 RepID=G2QIY1_THET4|nr:uncharacterized protein MYCTH_2309591 [Thermothelomyces thermophilus ATCC 42464]AEO60400.1 hypothetical protein MYCTH_2309591 [Thermothelomyces thermophilus ATCC 42464]
MEKAGQTSIDTHPARAPEGKTSRKAGVQIIATLYTAVAQRANNRHLCRQVESKKT